MRASDEDRQRAVDELRRHCAAGRIDVDEYASRIERALSAASLEELDEIRADLPMLRIAEPAGGRTRAGRPDPGRALEIVAGVRSGGGSDQKVVAIAVALVTVIVVLSAIVIILVAEWTWAVLLLVGWAVGLAQGRLGRRGGRGS